MLLPSKGVGVLPDDVIPVIAFKTFSLVSIFSPFLSVISSPTILYLSLNSVVESANSTCGSGWPFSNAFTFKLA